MKIETLPRANVLNEIFEPETQSTSGGDRSGETEEPPPRAEAIARDVKAHSAPAFDGLGEYEYAIAKKAVTLNHLVDALERKRACKDDQTRALYAQWFLNLKSTYGGQQAVEETYFCQNIAGGALLTATVREHPPAPASCHCPPPSDRQGVIRWRSHARPQGFRRPIRCLRACRQEVRHDIHVRYPTESVLAVNPEFAGILWRCLALSKQAGQLLRTKNSVAVHRTTYSIIVYLLSVLDSVDSAAAGSEGERDRKHRIQAAITAAGEQLSNARRQFEASARWASRYAYAKGMAVGVLSLAVAERLALWLIPSRSFAVQTLLAVVATGAIGAVVSVMTRMSSNSFYLDPLAEHKALWVLGAFRPLIGAFFGVAMFLIVDGGMLDLVPQAVETEPSKRVLFLAALGFLSGFSERFAKGVITAAEGDGQGTTPAQMTTNNHGATVS